MNWKYIRRRPKKFGKHTQHSSAWNVDSKGTAVFVVVVVVVVVLVIITFFSCFVIFFHYQISTHGTWVLEILIPKVRLCFVVVVVVVVIITLFSCFFIFGKVRLCFVVFVVVNITLFSCFVIFCHLVDSKGTAVFCCCCCRCCIFSFCHLVASYEQVNKYKHWQKAVDTAKALGKRAWNVDSKGMAVFCRIIAPSRCITLHHHHHVWLLPIHSGWWRTHEAAAVQQHYNMNDYKSIGQQMNKKSHSWKWKGIKTKFYYNVINMISTKSWSTHLLVFDFIRNFLLVMVPLQFLISCWSYYNS